MINEKQAQQNVEPIKNSDKNLAQSDKHSKDKFGFELIEAWDGEVNLAEVLDEIENIINDHVIVQEGASVAISLWIAFTWFIDEMEFSPILSIVSPDKQCGKTTLLTLIEKLVKKPIPSSNITPSALFRMIDECSPTLLIDEADTFLKNSEELRGIINSGHSRNNAFVIRSVSKDKDYKPKKFSTWSPKAIASIGNPPETIQDRSIKISLRRKLRSESVVKIRTLKSDKCNIIKQKLVKIAESNVNKLSLVIPFENFNVSDRTIDNWESLLAIANFASDGWFVKAQNSMQLICDLESKLDDESYGSQLLCDIGYILYREKCDKILSRDLLEKLNALEESPWSQYRQGRPLDGRELAKLLKPYSISSKSIRVFGETGKGFEAADFADAIARYSDK